MPLFRTETPRKLSMPTFDYPAKINRKAKVIFIDKINLISLKHTRGIRKIFDMFRIVKIIMHIILYTQVLNKFLIVSVAKFEFVQNSNAIAVGKL